ncbi:MAG: hypothetical protein COB98_02840 [Flavobacteriaceae bacterium]|nr:MAG: hypothetical protein COB98_02840 [Flavobacteriaceae bacterium]
MNEILETSKELGAQLWNSFGHFINEIVGFIPKLLLALAVWIIGKWIAKLLRKFIEKGLKLIKIDVIADKIELDQMLEQVGVKQKLSQIVANLVYYVLLLVVLLSVFDAVGLGIAKQLFDKVILFIPNLIIAIVLLVFGLFLANFVSTFISDRLKNMEIEYADAIGKISKFAIMLIAVSMVFSQLNIGNGLIAQLTQYLFMAVFFALAIALGLGGKNHAEKLLDKFFDNKK